MTFLVYLPKFERIFGRTIISHRYLENLDMNKNIKVQS